MFETLSYPPLLAIPAFPLLAAILIAILGPRYLKQHSYWFCIGGVVGACVLSLWLLAAVGGHSPHGTSQFCYTWMSTGSLLTQDHTDVAFQLQADGLTAIMLTAITFVGSLIAIYSVGYMHGDPGCPRFFAIFALFVFSMTGLVLADNFVVLYAFWEGVGLCSYLLIGFWFEKPAAAAAARKAFLVTRLGDVGLLVGILSIWYHCRGHLDYTTVFNMMPGIDPTIVTATCLLLLCGAVGKSAQFPLHVWLPDAMEGPTPVSALIHAATMVTAGVYLIARCTPIFIHAPDAQATVAVIGGFTALLAALIALTQNDLKRVLAYSTISQLGYMFMALGSATLAVGEHALVGFAVTAAIFHLFTHAFFKALLFLSAGSVMHAMGGVIDMRRIGGLRKVMPATHWTFLCGALALSAFPLFSGFWSKDEILSAVLAAGGEGHPHRTLYVIVFASGVLTAGLTSFYTFRGYFLTFWGDVKIPHEAGHHAHESPKVMTVPLMILAIGAVILGFVNAEPMTSWFSHYLGHVSFLEGGHEVAVSKALVMSVSIAIGLAGIGLAYFMYLVQPALPAQLANRFPALYQLSLNKFHFDELYYFFIVRPLLVIAEICRVGDLYLVDKLVDVVGSTPQALGRLFRPIQNGLVQFYALAMALGVTGFLLALMWRYAW
ncbi:MAG TPA: NADH-quinone oxidoreductase subunit L [Gemmataceae bacterium]|jgi:NADH-quinone oxidoreductase subunit L|nr:NADH-quinone oxidoreductase subunit L [Gemmataceae bacterium]